MIANYIKIYENTFYIGKYKENPSDRFFNKVFVTLEIRKGTCTDWETLKEIETYIVSFSGYIKCGRSIVSAGQIDHTIKENINKFENVDHNKIIKLLDLWEKYHMNNLKQGTINQEKLVEEYLTENHYNYEKICKYLEKKNKLVDNGYKYGSNWLAMPVNESEIDNIINFMESNFKVSS